MAWLTISEAAKKVPTTSGKRCGTATVWRWCVKGCRGVKLEHARFGRRVAISEEALDRFAVELARVWAEGDEPAKPAKSAPTRTGKGRTPARREKDVAAAETYLREQGVM